MKREKVKSLKESWKITERHLAAARALLPSPMVEFPESEAGSIRGFEDYLSHNELGLALDELEGLGEANHCPAEFWQELAAAAENMELTKQAEYYREKSRRK